MTIDSLAAKRVRQMGKSAIHEMTRLSRSIEDVAFLSWAKPTTGTPDHIDHAAVEAIQSGVTSGYSPSEGLLPLREEIVRKLERDNGIKADVSELLVTVGAIEGLAAAVMAIVDPGDEVILPSPTYSTHIRQVELASGVPVLVPSIEDKGFAYDLDAMEQAITPRTKAIFVCSPGNPTGTVVPEADLRTLAAIALKHNLVIITDEAYEYFVFDDHQHFSIGAIPEMAEHVISCYTFTKTYAMTGWRVGYLHAHSSWINQIKKTHIPFAICAPVVSQYAALAALTGPQQCVERFREHYQSARDTMCERLDHLPDFLSYQKPGGSYLMFPRVNIDEGKNSAAFCQRLLREARVSTTPGVAFGPTGEGHIRLSFCVPERMIHKAFDRMEAFFRASC